MLFRSVIGKSGEKIPKALALDYVYGYTIINDITDRKAQSEQDQAFLSKSLTGGCPMGPYIVTKDELPLPENVNIVTKVNNEIRQDGNTGEMILKIDELIEEISKYVALHPGDGNLLLQSQQILVLNPIQHLRVLL